MFWARALRAQRASPGGTPHRRATASVRRAEGTATVGGGPGGGRRNRGGPSGTPHLRGREAVAVTGAGAQGPPAAGRGMGAARTLSLRPRRHRGPAPPPAGDTKIPLEARRIPNLAKARFSALEVEIIVRSASLFRGGINHP